MTDTDGIDVSKRRSPRAKNSPRLSRTQESRAAEPVREYHVADFSQPTLLDGRHIPPRPGYVQRWVRVRIRGEDDASNLMKKYSQGWAPRSLDTIPNLRLVPRTNFEGSQVIGVRDVILMERPEEIAEAHRAAIRQDTKNQMRAVEETMFREHKPGKGFTPPRFEPETRSVTTVGSDPRRPIVADD